MPEASDHYRGYLRTTLSSSVDLIVSLATGRLRDGIPRSRWLVALVALDEWANALAVGRRGETISGRQGRRLYLAMMRRETIGSPRWWCRHCLWSAGYLPLGGCGLPARRSAS